LIPLNAQVTELRLTNDARYVRYLVSEYVSQKKYSQALYCVLAISILTGNYDKDLDIARKDILAKAASAAVRKGNAPKFTEKTVAAFVIDTNAIVDCFFPEINQVPGVATEEDRAALEAVFRGCPVCVPTIIKEELCNLLSKKGPNYKNTEELLETLLGKIRFPENPSHDPKIRGEIVSFYDGLLEKCEQVTLRKLSYLPTTDDKLKKLAERESFRPEKADLYCLELAIALSRERKAPVCVVSNERDSLDFANGLEGWFGIVVCSTRDPGKLRSLAKR
jgi:hypothetical protein